ncbi:MAG TPA: flagellar biosynthetic protein FliR [Alphaproteobacteria bacterium]|nr:flagellar biosynthetic protein FliR [Alphaproteobacteria bacterium]
MLQQLLSANLFGFFLVFARVGTALMLLPGFGESYVSTRIRLLLGLVLAGAVLPIVAPRLPGLPASPVALLVLLGGEILIGFFFGAIGRIMILGLSTAGSIIAYQASLANALVTDIIAAEQGAVIASFLTMVGVLLVFVTDLHHLALRALVDSYALFPPGTLPLLGDLANDVSRIVAQSFLIGVQIAAPLIVLGLVFFFGAGLLSRLMPQVQTFFVLQPLQITLGLLVMLLTISAGMLVFLDRFAEVFAPFARG